MSAQSIKPLDLAVPRLSRSEVMMPLGIAAVTMAAAYGATHVLGFYGLYMLTLIAIFGIVTTGLTMFMGYTGQISIGHAAFLGLGAYTAANVSKLGLGFPTAVVAGGLLSLLTGYAFGYVALRLRGFYLAIITLALGLIATQVFKNVDVFTGGVSGLGGIPPAAIFGVRVDTPPSYLIVTVIVLVAVMLLSWAVVRSPSGRAMRAIAANELAAQSVGIDTYRLKINVFALSTLYAGLAGGLYAHMIRFITPDHFSFNYSVEFLTMAIVGGLRNIFGGLVGAAVILICAEELRGLPQWQPILFGALLIVVAMFMPGGITGLFASGVAEVRRLRSKGSDDATAS